MLLEREAPGLRLQGWASALVLSVVAADLPFPSFFSFIFLSSFKVLVDFILTGVLTQGQIVERRDRGEGDWVSHRAVAFTLSDSDSW